MSRQPLSTQAKLWLCLITSRGERKTNTIGKQSSGTSLAAPTLDTYPENTLVPRILQCRHFGSSFGNRNSSQDQLSGSTVLQALGCIFLLLLQQGRCAFSHLSLNLEDAGPGPFTP